MSSTPLTPLLSIAASIAVLWVVYRLLFVNSNRFQFNRIFLLSALAFSSVLPVFGLLLGENAPQMVTIKNKMIPSYTLNEIVVTPGTTEATSYPITVSGTSIGHINFWQMLAVLYLIGVAISATLFLVKLAKLTFLIIRSPKHKMDGYTAVYTHRDRGSFSFFHYAFFPDESVSPDIVKHELSHIAHGHSWDILFVELIKIMQWFNPFVYFYKKELQSLHEYCADHDVVTSGADKKNYMMLILQQCTAVNFSNMSNNFSLILTKKRIKMIARNERAKSLWWRLLATIPVLAVLVFSNVSVAAQQTKKTDSKVNEPNTPEMTVVKMNNMVNDTIYPTCEVMPEFPGGVEMLMKYMAENIKYPEEAKASNISGKVLVRFVVETDGSVSDVEVVKGIGSLCDNEAVRVIKAMPKWKPGMEKGKPVRVNYCIPITFKLDDGPATKTDK